MITQRVSNKLITVMQEKFVTIVYDKTHCILIQTWYDYVPSDLFRDAIDTTVKFARENKVLGIISDALQQKVVATEDAQYAASVIPELAEFGLKAMAFV
ncbi:MAG: hypothetical protein MI922_17915, partial [Bacteroidales bacterium]|nr:hypothetical protein [Bacteroidales bacterium]